MNSQSNMEERLWEYIDGSSAPQERVAIEKLLETDAGWQASYQELLDMHGLIQSSALEEPSLRFTKNVMDEIARLQIAPAARSYINKNIIRSIVIFFITLIAGFLAYGMGQLDWKVTDRNIIPWEFGKIDYSRFFNNTYVSIFMMINVVLGLFLLDRYLANKRKKIHKEA
ncbi:MAG: hypothetical protein ABW019_06080 [Chitinophagaceae bacterium]